MLYLQEDGYMIEIMNNVEAQWTGDLAHDQAMLMRGKEGDELAINYLMNKYEGIVHKKANTFFLIGSDREDVIQEGLIGLYKAICDYDETKRSSFRTFAELCITRQIISSIKAATRQKHTPLNGYISIYKPINEDESQQVLIDVIEYFDAELPQESLLIKENMHHLQTELMKVLTNLEWTVLNLHLEGYQYSEIARQIGRSQKSIDNALQRIKRKVSEYIEIDVLYRDVL